MGFITDVDISEPALAFNFTDYNIYYKKEQISKRPQLFSAQVRLWTHLSKQLNLL